METADICIICEGSYPYMTGGVAEWVHELIQEHHEHTFHVLTLLPLRSDKPLCYTLPKNVISHKVIFVQDLPQGASKMPDETWQVIEKTIKGLVSSKTYEGFADICTFFEKYRSILGRKILSESMSAWDFFIKFYEEVLPSGPFKAYFGTILTLTKSFFSILLPELPKAKVFHAVCTGYAGFLLYRAKQEMNAPCILTEHGIYSNERRIEIAMSDWIAEVGSLDLSLEDHKITLKDFWLNAFLSMAHACYVSCDKIISTFDGNQELQKEGGADPKKMQGVVHGIKQEDYDHLRKERLPHTVAFIGRVVPIKDVKTFIWACRIVKEKLPHISFYAMGPTDEDPVYFAECQALVEELGLKESLKFTGRVNLKEYFPQIDLIVLTSISEAQPLVILEAGAAGIPCVATNIGACYQLIHGSKEEEPNLGSAGIVTPLVNPDATADAIIRMLTDYDFYKACSHTMHKRITSYYRFDQEHAIYRDFYNKWLV